MHSGLGFEVGLAAGVSTAKLVVPGFGAHVTATAQTPGRIPRACLTPPSGRSALCEQLLATRLRLCQSGRKVAVCRAGLRFGWNLEPPPHTQGGDGMGS